MNRHQSLKNIKAAAVMLPELRSYAEASGKWVIIHDEKLVGYDTPYFLSREAAVEAARRVDIIAEAYIVQV